MIGALAALLLAWSLIFALRRRLGLLASAGLFYLATLAWLRFGFSPPAPSSLVHGYGLLIAIALGLYLSSDDAKLAAIWRPLRRLATEPALWLPRAALLLGLPLLVGWQTWRAFVPDPQPPPRVRSVHPAPPSSFRGPGGRVISPARARSPFVDDTARTEAIARGRVVYYRHCFFCHGDTLRADGHLAPALLPPPANFSDPGTIAMLQESYLFWRIATGGPGLPSEGAPGDSAMPAWADVLSEDEIWSVVAFLYHETGFQPRAPASHEPSP